MQCKGKGLLKLLMEVGRPLGRLGVGGLFCKACREPLRVRTRSRRKARGSGKFAGTPRGAGLRDVIDSWQGELRRRGAGSPAALRSCPAVGEEFPVPPAGRGEVERASERVSEGVSHSRAPIVYTPVRKADAPRAAAGRPAPSPASRAPGRAPCRCRHIWPHLATSGAGSRAPGECSRAWGRLRLGGSVYAERRGLPWVRGCSGACGRSRSSCGCASPAPCRRTSRSRVSLGCVWIWLWVVGLAWKGGDPGLLDPSPRLTGGLRKPNPRARLLPQSWPG